LLDENRLQPHLETPTIIHQLVHDGYLDDGDYFEQPFRYIKHWSLWSSSGCNPHVLPTDTGIFTGSKKYTNAYLTGLIVPSEENNHYDAIKIRLDLASSEPAGAAYVSVDRSKRYRGFWIILANNGHSWYWFARTRRVDTV
jgi:hypothetical protein